LLTRRLRHPHVVGVYTFCEDDGYCFITMEYVDGPNLDALLAERERPFTLDEVLCWTKQLCAALDYAHDEGVLHRDVKPANVLVAKDGGVRLADFGIARTAREARTRLSGHLTSGTVMFMSPEQLMGEPLDRRSDLYSLASSVYELLSGAPPFYQGSIVTQIQMKQPSPIEGLPAGVNQILLRGLAKRPDERYETCGAFYPELAAAADAAERTPGHPFAASSIIHRVRAEDEEQTIECRPPAPKWQRMRLGILLVNEGLITEKQLEEALTSQKQSEDRLGRILVELGYVEEVHIARTLGAELGIQFVSLADEHVDPSVARVITAQVARQRKCLPMRREDRRVVIAMSDPLDLMTTTELEETYDAEADVRIVTESDLAEAIQRVYR
jgi:serine/threonine protein kinase